MFHLSLKHSHFDAHMSCQFLHFFPLLQSTGLQRVGHNCVTELNWTESILCQFYYRTQGSIIRENLLQNSRRVERDTLPLPDKPVFIMSCIALQSRKWQNNLCSFSRQASQYHSNPSLCPNHYCWRSWSWMVLWWPTIPSRTNTQKRYPFSS